MIITVIGGVDTGKSSLISRILIETGSINDREIDKIQKESKTKQWLANLVDTNPNEKEQGITLESSIEKFTYKSRSFHLINNPGHSSLLNEMIKNSSISDIGILVVSAKTNELSKSIINGFEHCLILRVNGINNLIICINKSEFINSNSNSFEKIVNEINRSIKKLKFEKVIFCPVSAKLNINIIKNDSNLVKYSLLDVIVNAKTPKRETKYIKTIENKLKAKLIFHKIPKVITKGFTCRIHSLDKTHTVEFDSIQNDDLTFITASNSKSKAITCTLKIHTNDHLDQNCLLRKCNQTIAYGVLYQLKKHIKHIKNLSI